MPFKQEAKPLPSLTSGQALIRTTLATICGSDLHTIKGMRSEPTPLILGHEGVGVVEQSKRDDVRKGDRVTWSIADSCGRCDPCARFHLPQKCDHLFKYGHASLSNGTGLNGTYGSHIVLRAGTHIVRLPSHVSDAVAAPANCALATVCNALDSKNLSREGTWSTALVQGAGMLGIYAVAWLKHQLGFQTVFCADSHTERLRIAEQFGAVPLPVTKDPTSEGRRLDQILAAAPHGVDVVVEVVGSASVVSEGLRALRVGGHYAIAGMVHPATKLDEVSGEQIIRKSITIRGTHNYAPQHLDAAVAFLGKHSKPESKSYLPFDTLVSPPFSFAKLEDAVEEAYSQRWPRVSVHFKDV